MDVMNKDDVVWMMCGGYVLVVMCVGDVVLLIKHGCCMSMLYVLYGFA